MGNDDLFDILDLGARPGRASREPIRKAAAPEALPLSASPFCFDHDEWGLRRGEDLARDGRTGLDATSLADLHHVAFASRPELLDSCSDRIRHEFIRELMETPDYKALHKSTSQNAAAAEAAATEFAKGLAKLKSERKAKASRPSGKARKGSDPGEGLDTLRAVGEALDAAGKATDEILNIEGGILAGMGGSTDGRTDAKSAAEAFRRVRNSSFLRAIVESAGRFRRVARSKQRMKMDHGIDEIVGITIGDEIERLVPMEIARMALPEMELDTFRRIAEHQAIVWEKASVSPEGKGPIVVIVDESSSMMSHNKITLAKGLALTMAWLAKSQNRWAVLVGFADETSLNPLILPPSGWDENALLNWLEHFFRGGTEARGILRTIPDKFWPEWTKKGLRRGKTDILVITDGAVNVDPFDAESFLKWKKAENVKMTTINIRARGNMLNSVCDESHDVDGLDADGEAVGKALSI